MAAWRRFRSLPCVAFMAALSLSALVPDSRAQAQGGLIVVPLEPGAAGLDVEALDRLNAERFARERVRGTQADMSGIRGGMVSPLRPVEARGQPQGTAIRFDGESRTLDFALFVPEPAVAHSLRIATQSSINVLPERSQFQVWVNDRYLGAGPLENFTQFGAIDLPVEPGMLVRGHNRVQIRLTQYHRIFCGPEASFALWTDIDLAGSGAVIDAIAGDGGEESFLMGVALAGATANGIEIRGTAGLGEQRGAWISAITQQLTAALGGDPVPFRFTDFWSVQTGHRTSARITFLPGTAGRISYRTGGDGAQVMVIEYTPGQAAANLPAFDLALPAIGTRTAPVLIDTMVPVPFSDFGFRPVEVRDRYALIEQRFRLPHDFVVLTNAKAEFRLDYIYAEDLPNGSMLLVHVNGTNIRLLPLRGAAGRLIEQFPVRFEARLLRSGINTLGFEVMVPGAPADLPCPISDTPVLAIGAGSTINVPYSPSMYLPDMHYAFNALTAQSIQAQAHTARAFSSDDVVTLRAALAGSTPAHARDIGARLHLLSLDDLAALPLGGYQISRHAIENVLLSLNLAESPVAEGLGASLLRASGGVRQPSAALFGGWDWAMGLFNAARQWMHPRSGTLLDEWLERQQGQAIFLQLDPANPETLWLLRAPGADITGLASAVVAARTVTDGPRGQVAVLDHEGRWHNWVAPDRQPVLLEPVTFGNLRHVLGNLVSAMPIRYVMVLFFLALVSALLALRLVISTREHDT